MRWSKLNQDELTALLRGMGLPAQGTKKELARRLGDHIESLGPPPPELAAANADSNSRRKALAAASSEDPGAHSEATGPASDDAVSELLSAEGAAGSTGRSGRSGGRRNRIHPRNWGYTTYLDRVFGMRCFNELVRLRVFPDAKDISESYGALQAAARYGGLCDSSGAALDSRGAERRRGVLCINIGDGATPRTAALAAYLTAWTAVSVDPAMRPEWEGKHPQGIGRLWSYGAKFEEWAAEPSGAMSEVGAECVETSALQEGGQQQDEMEDQPEVAAEGEASRAAAAAKEAADAEAKASIAYIKASPAVRNAWISWLEAQAESSTANQTEATESEPSGLAAAVASAGTARGAVGLAAIGFDPALHTQETRAAFCAEHQRGTPAPGAIAEHAAATLPVVVEGVAHLVLICVHAHNRFTGVAAMERIRGHYGFPPTVLVSLPCCHQFNPTNDLGRLPDEDFEDLAIFSACRRVLVWRWARGPAPQQPFPPIVAGNSGPSPGSNRASGKRARRPPAEEDGTGAGLDFAQADA